MGGKAPWKGLGGPRRTKMEHGRGIQHELRQGQPLSGPEEAPCMWAQPARGARCGLPAQGDSVLQPRLPDNAGKYEACKSIRKHSLFRCLLPSRSSSLKLFRDHERGIFSQSGCGQDDRLASCKPTPPPGLLLPGSPYPPHATWAAGKERADTPAATEDAAAWLEWTTR